ncbi:MAG TPA: DUF4388 domain-containing protein [Thermoanaerobaculales bacterium]|nr:DUF4388 domain-containing protein [Thermoanaerobaculales bacterium]
MAHHGPGGVCAVPIIADIEDLAPAELLLVLSLASKTGRLYATRDDQKIMLVLRKGSIVHAVSPAVRERLGGILVKRGAITEPDLQRALALQAQQLEPKVLGTFLVDLGLVSSSTVQQAVFTQFEAVIRQLLAWDRGALDFQPSEVPDTGAIPIDPTELLVVIGYENGSPLLKSLVGLALKRSARAVPRPSR